MICKTAIQSRLKMRATADQNLTDIIDQYRNISRDISREIEAENFEGVRVLDDALVEKFSLILGYKPLDPTEEKNLVEFLLEILAPSVMRSPVTTQICNKLTSNFD